ncbi:MAG: hypothetical protein ACTSQ4_03575 [Candidatus Heimdallarchaeaceae archaeon]
MKKTTIITLIFLFGILIFSSFQPTYASADYGITSIEHSPNPLLVEQNMIVTVEFYDSSEVEALRLLVCELAPNFICDPAPIMMDKVGNTFSAEYVFTQEINATIGYHIQILYLNETFIIIPDSQDFLSMENIVEPLTGDFYFSAGEIEEVNTSDGFTIGLISSAILISALLINRKRE